MSAITSHYALESLTPYVSEETQDVISKVALGILACALIIPLIDYAVEVLSSTMLSYGFDLTADQEVIQVLNFTDSIPFGFILKVGLIFYITVVGPIFEEWAFRDVLNEWMKTEVNDPVLRVLGNGILFGACHLSPFQGWFNIPVFVATALMGIGFATLKEMTGDIIAPSAAHITNNTAAMVLYYFSY